ncbi:hypothetical protein U8527_09850 [Kordia algicida OT-1]|uniref:Uncharacterized protein n=1 Tax=Kordia algicida OT-1 TaxID=391587 RepID=A9DVC8_9FLAO|nr:hypothetical protein [Kordia algicida]EDP96404.1 hypothetical protein KAOT1_03307 [Kordia algicida OT-1]
MYLIWRLINTAFFILFFGLVLTLFTKGKKLFNNQYGNAIIVVFVIGVIGMLGAKERDFKNEYIINKDIKGHNVRMPSITLEDNIPFDIHLSVGFKKDASGKLIPSYSSSDMSGYLNGHVWEFRYANISRLNEEEFSYMVTGSMHWHLFGIKVYSQSKTFEGTFSIE